MELLIRRRPLNANWTVAYTSTISVHPENNQFIILNDPHVIGTLDGSTRPYPSWNDVDWVLIGTVTRIKTDDNGVFEMLFIAIGASIRTFLNYLRPVLMIDVVYLKGLYKGTNLVVVVTSENFRNFE
ncbi:hypothetical protein Tco_1205701 [Tanacetum coccineum]